MSPTTTTREVEARAALDAHVREIVRWHFSGETGTPVWLQFAKSCGFDPLKDVRGFDDLVARFPQSGEAQLARDRLGKR